MPENRTYAATQSQIGQLLSGTPKLGVPAHQRNYEWGEEEVTQFWQDCIDVLERRTEKLFLGSIVVNQQEDVETPGRLSIVDGQQRLATATILFACIYQKADSLRATGTQIFPDTILLKIGKKDMRTGDLEANIVLNLADRTDFSNLISRPPQIDDLRVLAKSKSQSGRSKFYAAYVLLHDKIEALLTGKTPGQQADALINLFQIVDTISAINVTVVDDTAAYDLFETLNDRGLPLSIVDLLKNHLFRYAGDGLPAVKHSWQVFENKFRTKRAIPYFVTFVWRATKGTVRRHELFRKIKDGYSNRSQCEQFIKLLNEFADAYVMLDNPEGSDDWPENTKCQDHASDLDLLGTTQWYPLAMSSILKLDGAQLEKVLNGLVKFVIRYTVVCERPPTYLEEGFSQIAVKVWNGEFTTWGQIRDQLKLIAQFPTDVEFANDFPSCQPRPREARYMLEKLEAKLSSNPDFSARHLSIEHILPENPERQADWDPAFFERPELIDSYKQRMSNLILLSRTRNRAARNKSFASKKSLYQSSEFALSQKVGALQNWTKADMENWGALIANEAKQIWSLS